jgi:hypothetical protein
MRKRCFQCSFQIPDEVEFVIVYHMNQSESVERILCGKDCVIDYAGDSLATCYARQLTLPIPTVPAK